MTEREKLRMIEDLEDAKMIHPFLGKEYQKGYNESIDKVIKYIESIEVEEGLDGQNSF